VRGLQTKDSNFTGQVHVLLLADERSLLSNLATTLKNTDAFSKGVLKVPETLQCTAFK
jgi:hypothetical protein